MSGGDLASKAAATAGNKKRKRKKRKNKEINQNSRGVHSMNTVSIENEGKQRQVLHKGTPSYEEYKRKAVKEGRWGQTHMHFFHVYCS